MNFYPILYFLNGPMMWAILKNPFFERLYKKWKFHLYNNKEIGCNDVATYTQINNSITIFDPNLSTQNQ